MKKLFIYLLLLFPAILNAQEVKPLRDENFQMKDRNTSGVALQYELGYGSFQLKDIKDILEMVKNTMYKYGARITDNFPNHFTHSASIGYISDLHYLGVCGSFLTTGGRVHVADYSGEYKTDMLLKGIRFGLFYRYYFPSEKENFNMYIQMGSGILHSRLKMNEKLDVYNQRLVTENMNFKSKGWYFEPSIGARFKLLDWLHLPLGAGYEIDTGGEMKRVSKNQPTSYKIIWNGFRLNAGLILIPPK